MPSNTGQLYIVHNDHLGTPQVLTDEAGTVVWTASYAPFGKATLNDDPDNNGNAITYNQRFPGQYYDQETQLHYNYFRYYDPSTGRYLTADPIGLAGGINIYLYGKGNPIRYVDPLGLLACEACVTNCIIIFNRETESITDFFLEHGAEGCEFSDTPQFCELLGSGIWIARLHAAEKRKTECLNGCDAVCDPCKKRP